ncbi:MAG: FeoC-like transcriptional regulator [Chloroflexota bacterium]
MQSKLRQVLTVFETADSPRSLPQIARDLDLPVDRLEGMIQHWVRKGKIRPSGSLTECGTCGHQGGCPFVMTMPRSYELINDVGLIR